jgi:signal transduction histidine kinase
MPGALPFSIACILGALWLIGIIFELAAVDISLKIFWRKFQVMFQLPSATAITCFLLEYTWPKRWLTRRNLILLSIVPILALVLISTNDLHHLLWEGFMVQEGELVAIDGSLINYFLAYVTLNFFINLIIFIWLFIHSPQNRWPVAIMVVGQITMRLLYFIDIADKAFISIHFTAVGLAFTSLMYAIAFYRFQILGPIPLAMQVMIEQLPMGVLILDDQGKIRKLNHTAEQMLKLTPKAAKGMNISQVLPIIPNQLLKEDWANVDELSWNFEDDDRYYQLSSSLLRDWRDAQVGQLLLLEDVTTKKEAQTKILEQQGVVSALKERELISRELHDDLAQVFAFIDIQGQTIQRLFDRGDLETANNLLVRLIGAARNGEMDVREAIRGMRSTLLKNGLLAALEDYLVGFETNTSIQVELVKSEIFDITQVSAMVENQLLWILQEALTNIRKHAHATKVQIKLDKIDASTFITVQDNGQGFEINGDAYAPKNHFGLLMMQERVKAIGGTIKLTSEPGQGTKVSICVPIQER